MTHNQNNRQLQVVEPKMGLSAEDLKILQDSMFRGFTHAEMAYASKVVGLLNLNPFLRQIHFKKMKNKDGSTSIVTVIGIDGFRLTAERAKTYAGSDEPVFSYAKLDTREEYPTKAMVTVYKMVSGARCSFTASARWDEFYPGKGPNSFMWDKMPHNQLAKCAEALALRKAFPAELSNVYAEEELHQVREPDGVGIYPEQPGPDDGAKNVDDGGYRIPFGKYQKRALEEVPFDDLRSYIRYLEDTAKKRGETLKGNVLDFIERASAHIAAFENSDPGADR